MNCASKCLWPVMMTYLMLWNWTVWTIRLPTIHQRERVFVVLVLQSRSWRGESSPNDSLTNNSYSMSTLRSNDLETGWRKPSVPPVSGRLLFRVWRDQTSLNSGQMFESSSPCSCDELGQVWLQTRMQEDVSQMISYERHGRGWMSWWWNCVCTMCFYHRDNLFRLNV